jgi:pyruvate/2-oxoacid:ferredoxin oxidoreductase alpha subunit
MPYEASASRRQRVSGAVIYLTAAAQDYEIESREQVRQFMLTSSGEMASEDAGKELDETFSDYEIADLRRIAQTDAVQAIYGLSERKAKKAFNRARKKL